MADGAWQAGGEVVARFAGRELKLDEEMEAKIAAILERFDTTVFEVSWVLTSFNVVLALLVLPAARLAGRSGSAGDPLMW